MRNARAKGFERGAVLDVWRHTLSQLPSVFNRLVYLSSLRDSNDGRYHHHGLIQLYGDREAHAALERSHEQSFQEWLVFTLEEQKADLDLYLSSLDGDKPSIITTWSRLAYYRNVPPANSRESERNLFLADFEVLLAVLRAEYGVSAPDRDA